MKQLQELKPEQCVYVDEAGIENSLNYAYGWAKKGHRCIAEKLGHFTQRISMIAAYCQHRVFSTMTFSGYCDSSLVETWLEKVLIPELKPNQVVILDNASFHRKAILQKLLQKVDCKLLPLPPYSPDLNKIEFLWNSVKSFVSHSLDPDLLFHDKVDLALCSV